MKPSQDMSIIVKVVANNSVFNLGKNIKTYDDLIQQAQNRFSQIKDFQFEFDGKVIEGKGFETVIKTELQKGQKSIKLKLVQSSSQTVNTEIQTKSKKFAFNPKDFDEDNHPIQKKDSKSSEESFSELKENEFEGESQRQVENEPQINPDTIKVKILMGDQLSSIKKDIGEEYTWSCTLINQNNIQIPKGVFVKETATGKLVDISGIGAKDAEEIQFGPYIEKEAGKFTRFYQIVYKNKNDELCPIGSKFGFVCEAVKKLSVKEMNNKVYVRVNNLREFSACEKSTQYIVSKLKEFEIEENNIHKYKDEDLIDIFQSFNLIDQYQ